MRKPARIDGAVLTALSVLLPPSPIARRWGGCAISISRETHFENAKRRRCKSAQTPNWDEQAAPAVLPVATTAPPPRRRETSPRGKNRASTGAMLVGNRRCTARAAAPAQRVTVSLYEKPPREEMTLEEFECSWDRLSIEDHRRAAPEGLQAQGAGSGAGAGRARTPAISISRTAGSVGRAEG